MNSSIESIPMKKRTVFSILLSGLKHGAMAILATALFLPLPIIIGEYFGRISMVGHYSGPLPASWVFGFSIATAITFSLPLLLIGCVLSLIIALYNNHTSSPKETWGRISGAVLGVFAMLGGSILFEKLGLLEALGGWIFIGIMLIWGIVLFGWIGHRMQQSVNQSAEHVPSPNIKDEPN